MAALFQDVWVYQRVVRKGYSRGMRDRETPLDMQSESRSETGIKVTRSAHKVGTSPLFWGYLALVTAAELITSLIDLQIGMMCHMALVLIFVVQGALGRTNQERRLALAMTVVPFIRLLSLSLPLAKLPQVAWYPMVAVPILLGAWYIARQVGASRRDLGLVRGEISLQLLLVGGGLGLGALEYAILRPRPMLSQYGPVEVIVGALSLIIFTGFNEELIFRGFLQSLSGPIMGRLGPLYVSLLFGALHIGYLSILDVVFVTAVGLLFSYVVRWGGSILGVTLMHGLTNSTLFILMPYLWANPRSDLASVAPWTIGAGSLLSAGAVIAIWRHARPSKVSSPYLVAASVTAQTGKQPAITPVKPLAKNRRSKSNILHGAAVCGGVLLGVLVAGRLKVWVER